MSEDERLLLCGTVVVKLMVLEIEPALKRGKDMTPSHAFNDNVPQFRTRTKALRRITPAGIHYRGIELGNSNNTQGRNIKKHSKTGRRTQPSGAIPHGVHHNTCLTRRAAETFALPYRPPCFSFVARDASRPFFSTNSNFKFPISTTQHGDESPPATCWAYLGLFNGVFYFFMSSLFTFKAYFNFTT